jgi:hypothetical protein
MSSPEVDWVLDQLASVADTVATNYTLKNGDAAELKRVDRDDAQLYEGSDSVDMSSPIHTRTEELTKAALVGATRADVSDEPIGTEYDHDREAVVGVRIEGLTCREFGHIDPAGNNGIPFDDDGGLVEKIRDAILAERHYPAAGGSGVTYTDLQIANEAPQSSDWQDYFRHDFDILFNGYEELP